MMLLIIFLIISLIVFATSVFHWANRDILSNIPRFIIENIKLNIKNNKYTNLGSITDVQLYSVSHHEKLNIEVKNAFNFIFLVKKNEKYYLFYMDVIKKDNNWISNYKRHEYIPSKSGNAHFLFSKYVLDTFFCLVLPLKLMKFICIISGICTFSIGSIVNIILFW